MGLLALRLKLAGFVLLNAMVSCCSKVEAVGLAARLA